VVECRSAFDGPYPRAPLHSLVLRDGNGRPALRIRCPFCRRPAAAKVITSTKLRCDRCGLIDKADLYDDLAAVEYDEWER
jgi:hypothetical protein